MVITSLGDYHNEGRLFTQIGNRLRGPIRRFRNDFSSLIHFFHLIHLSSLFHVSSLIHFSINFLISFNAATS